jgi:hypothetical protein
MFSRLVMPREAYDELVHKYAMPLHVSKPVEEAGIADPHYMSFEEAALHPLSDKH